MPKKTIKNVYELGENITEFSRNEIYKKIKPTIDAANKRLKRQGVNIKLSTKGKDKIQLLATLNEALNVGYAQQTIPKQRQNPPKQRKSKTVKQLPKNFEKMKRDEFIKQIQPTIDAANKRLKRLEQSQLLSPAYDSVINSGGKFSLKGKDRNAVLKEASRAIAFMNMDTSTLQDAKRYEENFARKLSNKAQNISKDQRKVLFNAFRKIEQISPVGLNLYGSDRLIRMLGDEITDENYNFESTMQKALKELEEEYEKIQAENMEELGDIWDL